ncbi:MAG: zinc ABC transporter substrate-binding protein [Rhabdochlamydiaceae bacterium]|nr:zinc ABC transporter substrate-binding protein [Rhabdochlamydiaceae bacterium]
MLVLRALFITLILTLTSCGKEASNSVPSPLEEWISAKDRIRVLSTTAMIDDIVGRIGKDRIVHIPLISGEIDPHSYELVKGDDEKLSFARIIFYNGLGLEHGASLRYQLETHPHAVAVGEAVKAASPDQIIYVDRQTDPHIWMDIALWSGIIPSIVEALSSVDPEGSSFYEANGDELQSQMLEAHQLVAKDVHQVPEAKRYLVTSHDAFNYFTRAYLATSDETTQAQWQIRFEAPEGLAPDGQLGATDIQHIVEHLSQYKINVIFAESNVSRDSLKKIINACERKGLTVRIAQGVLYADAMGGIGSGAETYLDMVRHDADVLIAAWQ